MFETKHRYHKGKPPNIKTNQHILKTLPLIPCSTDISPSSRAHKYQSQGFLSLKR